MKLIIDISERAYESIKSCGYVSCDFNMIKAIREGIPLPKGHGRLVDTDTLKKKAFSQDWFENIVNVEDIDNAPTIIEAEWYESEPLDDVVELMEGESE